MVGRSAKTCTECGADLGRVSTPGIGRVLSGMFPGATTTTSLIFLVNGFWFAMMMLAQAKAGGGGGLFSGFNGELMARFGSGLSRPHMLSDGTITGCEWWRLITPIFLHGGLLHFFFNSYILLRIGPVVEELYGPGRYWVIYLGCGIAGVMTLSAISSDLTLLETDQAVTPPITTRMAITPRQPKQP